MNRKNFYSLNVMIVSGCSHRIFTCSTNKPGSFHDARVFEESRLYNYLRTGQYLPFTNAVLLGDSAYCVSIQNYVLFV